MQPEQERIETREKPEEKITGYVRAFWPDGAHEGAVPLAVYAGALVVAAPWPSALRAEWPKTLRTLASPEGAYAFQNMAPGEDRIFAIDAGLRMKLEEPGVLLRLIGNAEGAELREGGGARLDLRPVEP